MITEKHFAAALGFAFAAAWITLGFGYAILCLVGAGAFYFVAAYLKGEVDLGELGDRVGRGQSTPGRAQARPNARVR